MSTIKIINNTSDHKMMIIKLKFGRKGRREMKGLFFFPNVYYSGLRFTVNTYALPEDPTGPVGVNTLHLRNSTLI